MTLRLRRQETPYKDYPAQRKSPASSAVEEISREQAPNWSFWTTEEASEDFLYCPSLLCQFPIGPHDVNILGIAVVEVASKYLESAHRYIKPRSLRVASGAMEIPGPTEFTKAELANICAAPLLRDMHRIDMSTDLVFSVTSRLDMKSETNFILATAQIVPAEISEEDIVTAMVRDDFIVRMSPIREYKIRVKIKSVEKATPRIVEPEVI